MVNMVRLIGATQSSATHALTCHMSQQNGASLLAFTRLHSACCTTTLMAFISTSLVRLGLITSVAWMVSSCAHRVTQTTPTLPAPLPATWQSDTVTGDLLPFWLSSLHDPALEQLVRDAWVANPNVIVAAARYEQAVARARQTGTQRLPSLNLDAGAGRARTNTTTPLGTSSLYTTNYNLGLSVAWEIDVWGRLGSFARADVAEATATHSDTVAAYRSLAAQVARAWYRLGYEQLRLALIENFHEVSTMTERLLSERYRDGRAPAVDVHAARADLARAKVDVAERQRAVKEAARALETLVGRYPAGNLVGPVALPQPPPTPPAGVPATVLLQRPDLAAAQQRLLASDQRLAGSRADLLPRISLTASGGARSNDLRDLFDPEYLVWNLLGNLTQPLFDGGRRSAVVDEQRARVTEASANWAVAAINALREVETALANGEIIQTEVTHSQQAADESETVVKNLRDRYRDGLTDGLTLLREQRTALNQQVNYLVLRLDQLLIRIDLLLAFGGATLDDEADIINRAVHADTSAPVTPPTVGDKP
jgi:NodT family efflux transporter outer membrane factor (OMF) lipoprotein